jgi:hypothetical protein
MLCRMRRTCWLDSPQLGILQPGVFTGQQLKQDDTVITLTERDPVELSTYAQVGVLLTNGQVGTVPANFLERC